MSAISLPPALSIRQPHAHWIIHGHETRGRKDIENRPWRSFRRGWVLIHAGLQADRMYASQVTVDMPRGGIVGAARILDSVPSEAEAARIERAAYRRGAMPQPSAAMRRAWASPWFSGPYGFVLADAVALPFTPCRGALSFFAPTLTAEETEALLDVLRPLMAESPDGRAPYCRDGGDPEPCT